jgi:hypothetical protein
MADLNVTPQTTLLTEMLSITFQATDAAGAPLPVAWSISPGVGMIAPVPLAAVVSASATYSAPQKVSSPQTVSVTANSPTGKLASATVFLTPNSLEIIPATVELRESQSQQFIAKVAGDPENSVTWIISPAVGKLENGLYTAPSSLLDSATIRIIATSSLGNQTGLATVTLFPPPWTGKGRNAVGIYLLAVFLSVFVLVALWPQAVPDPATARADRIEAAKNADDKATALKRAEDTLDLANTSATSAQNQADKDAGKTKVGSAQVALAKAQQEKKDADLDLVQKSANEKKTTDTHVDTWLGSRSRDTDLLWLVLLGGALGSFLHSARSFADFVGNKQIKGSWGWWYFLHPFMGSTLALIFYMAVRGGFLAVTGGTTKASDLNPYGVASMAAFVGMFSKQATEKLADVFNTLFKSDQSKNTKDQLHSSTQSPSSTAPSAQGGTNTPKVQT